MKNEVGEIRNLMQHVECLKQEVEFPSEPHEFRRNETTRESHIKLKGSPESTKILQSSGDLSTNHPPGLSGSSGSSGRCSQQPIPVESFKRSIKRDSSNFTNFKEGKHWDAWRRK